MLTAMLTAVLTTNVDYQWWLPMLSTNIDYKCWLPVLTKNVDWQCWKVVNDNQFWLTMLTTNADYQYWLPVWLLMLTTDTDYQCWLPFALIMQSEAISRNGWQNLQNISDSLTLQHGSRTLGPKKDGRFFIQGKNASLLRNSFVSRRTLVSKRREEHFFSEICHLRWWWCSWLPYSTDSCDLDLSIE